MFWRRKNSNKDKDYEKLLEDIDFEIKKIEENLRQIKIREDRSIVTWLYYSIPAYSLVLIVYSFILYQSNDPWPILLIHASPLLIGLFLIIFIKKFITIWFKKQQMKEEEKSGELKKEQKEILEELKNKLKYYQTKNLIEKYELNDQPVIMKNNNVMMHPNMMINGQRMNPNQMMNPQLTRKQQLMNGHSISKQRSMPVVLQSKQINNKNFNQQQLQQQQLQQQQLQQQQLQQQPISPSNPNERKWIDKLMDAIVGDVNEVDSRYALVCNFCYTHCGLALPEEYKTFKYICPNCKKLNDNAKKYNIKEPAGKERPIGNPMSLPPTAPNSKPPKNIPEHIRNAKSAPASPLKPSTIIPNDINNDKKPNLTRRSSTLLEEMDDSDTNSFNQNIQAPVDDKEKEVIVNGESNEVLDQEANALNQVEEEIEQEKEIINYPEEENENNEINDNINSTNTLPNNEEDIQNEIVDDAAKEEPIEESHVKESLVDGNEQIGEEQLQQ